MLIEKVIQMALQFLQNIFAFTNQQFINVTFWMQGWINKERVIQFSLTSVVSLKIGCLPLVTHRHLFWPAYRLPQYYCKQSSIKSYPEEPHTPPASLQGLRKRSPWDKSGFSMAAPGILPTQESHTCLNHIHMQMDFFFFI